MMHWYLNKDALPLFIITWIYASSMYVCTYVRCLLVPLIEFLAVLAGLPDKLAKITLDVWHL